MTEEGKSKFTERLFKSISMIKEVLQTNLKLRGQVEQLTQRISMQNAEIFHLQCENDDQKDKIQILSNIGQKGLPDNHINADEVLKLRREKTMLEQRVYYLEMEIKKLNNNYVPVSNPSTSANEFTHLIKNSLKTPIKIMTKNNEESSYRNKNDNSKVLYNSLDKSKNTTEYREDSKVGHRTYKRGNSTVNNRSVNLNMNRKPSSDLKLYEAMPPIKVPSIKRVNNVYQTNGKIQRKRVPDNVNDYKNQYSFTAKFNVRVIYNKLPYKILLKKT